MLRKMSKIKKAPKKWNFWLDVEHSNIQKLTALAASDGVAANVAAGLPTRFLDSDFVSSKLCKLALITTIIHVVIQEEEKRKTSIKVFNN